MEKHLREARGRLSDKKNRGFSLIVVLIISMIALTLAGMSLNVSMNSAGAGRTNSARDVKYNILQDGIEQGKAALMQLVNAAPQIPKYTDRHGGTEPTEITALDTLLIDRGDVLTETWTKSKLGRLGIAGDNATFKVRIYDMQYKPGLVPSVASGKITAKEMESFPPAVTLTGKAFSSESTALDPDDDGTVPGLAGNSPDSAGIYLIRASLEIGGRDYSLDTAVIQSRKN
jgi:Tfp pilus assembly protein PilV